MSDNKVVDIKPAKCEPKREHKREREKLPDERPGIIHHFTIYYLETENGEDVVRELDGYIRANTYPDGRLGEIFITIGKPGSTDAMYDQWALLASIALQHGISVNDVFGKFVGQRYGVSGGTKNPNISQCSSILDYVAKYIIARYGTKVETLPADDLVEAAAK